MEELRERRQPIADMNIISIGMAGLDTSHVSAFAKLLHDASNAHHVAGARVVAAFPGGSPDFDLSINRVEGLTTELKDSHSVEIVDSLAALRGKCDAVMLESIDGRVHLAQFQEVAEWGVPIFIDKPLTVSFEEAKKIAEIARDKGTRVTSASALRFSEVFQETLKTGNEDAVISVDCYGPMPFQEKCPGYFWYGIHSAEMLFAAMGEGCREVLAVREELHDVIVGRWKDGRLGVLRGNRSGNNKFGGVIHRKSGSTAFDVSRGVRPYYASLLERIIPFFRGESELVPSAETVEVIGFLEAANHSVSTGKWTSPCAR